MKKIVVIGASGTIGQFITRALEGRHEVIAVGSKSGALQADIADRAQVEALFAKIGQVDGVVVAAGALAFAPFAEFTQEQFDVGLRSKLMGQVNVAQVAQRYLNAGGSITLTSGIVSDVPVKGGVSASMVNSAIDGFVRGAAAEMSRGLRINVVSPTILEESMPAYGALFGGFEAAPGARVAQAYVRSIEGIQNGQVFKVW